MHRKIAVALALCLSVGLIAAEASVQVDRPAPGFSLPDTSGESRSLSDFKDKTVVLEWHNHLCPYVVKWYSSGEMQKLQKKYTDKDVVWLSIISSAEGKQGHCTGPEADKNMQDAKAHPSYTLLDPSGEVGRMYGAKTTPHMYIIDPSGKLRYNGAIDSIKSANPADIAEADPLFADALDAVLAGKSVSNAVNKPYGCSVKYGPKTASSEKGEKKKKSWWPF